MRPSKAVLSHLYIMRAERMRDLSFSEVGNRNLVFPSAFQAGDEVPLADDPSI
jgi:hypothetical protein